MTQRWKTVKKVTFWVIFWGGLLTYGPNFMSSLHQYRYFEQFFTPRHAPKGAIYDFWPISSMWDPEKWPKDEKRWKKWLLGSIFSGVGRLWTPFLGLKCARMTPDMEGRYVRHAREIILVLLDGSIGQPPLRNTIKTAIFTSSQLWSSISPL